MAKRIDPTDAVDNTELDQTNDTDTLEFADRSEWTRAEVPVGFDDAMFSAEIITTIPAKVVKHAEKLGWTLRWVTTARQNPHERIHYFQRYGGQLVSPSMLASLAPEWLKSLQKFEFRDSSIREGEISDRQLGVQVGTLVLMAIPMVVRERRQAQVKETQKEMERAAERKYSSIDTGIKGTSKQDVSYARRKPSENKE